MNSKKPYTLIAALLLLVFIPLSCSDSTSSAEEDRNRQQFNLILQSNGQSVGTVVTEDALEGDDTRTSEAFFITITISDSNFGQPLDVTLDHADGRCFIGNVFSEERRDMPCAYQRFLDDQDGLRITADDGDGDVAVLDL